LQIKVGKNGRTINFVATNGVQRLSSPEIIEEFLGKLKVSLVTRDNYKRAVSRFFSWCIERPRRWTATNPCREIRIEKGEKQPPVILTLKQCEDLLRAAEAKEIAPYVAVCLFGGLRPFEATRLTWQAVNLQDKEIRLEGNQTKTGRARVVAICPTLLAWLKAHKDTPFFPSNWRKTFDADFQHHLLLGSRQDILWGLGVQYTYSHSDGDFLVSLSPSSAGDYLFSSFIQDEIALIHDRLYLTVGAKLEHNYYTGWAPIPSARVAWQINSRHMFWTAYSRPIRTPAETDVAIISSVAEFPGPGGLPTLVSIVGNPNYGNETTSVYEFGYRASLAKNFSLDLALYYNNYKNLQTNEPGAPYLTSTPAPLHLVLPLTFDNLLYGEAHGLEVSANWKVTGRWSISPGYAFEEIHMHTKPSSQDTSSVSNGEGSSPRHSAQLRSRVDLSHGLEWNATVYFVDRLIAESVPASVRVDTQLTWKWSERGSVSLVGQNLQQDHHFEFQDFLHSIDANQVKRSAYAVLRWSY